MRAVPIERIDATMNCPNAEMMTIANSRPGGSRRIISRNFSITACVGACAEESRPKLVVTMGEPALAFLNSVEFPLARELQPLEGELQKLTPTIDALATPDIDESLDEQAAKTRFWNAFKPLGAWWAELPPY